MCNQDRVAFIGYSVKAANEAKTRAQIKLGLGMDEMPYFCTSHAFARAMNIGRVMIGADIKDFLEKYSFTLTKNYLMTSKVLSLHYKTTHILRLSRTQK